MSGIRILIWMSAILAVISAAGLYSVSTMIHQKKQKGEASRLSPVPSFTLNAHTGEKISNESLRGYVWIAGFFFTRCTGICPLLEENMKKIQDQFRNQSKVKILLFSVDPKNDTREKLVQFAKTIGAIDGKWYFVFGKQGEVTELSRKGFLLGATEVPGEILHSDRFVLVDADGFIRGYYKGTEEAEIKKLIEDTKTLLRGEEP